MGRLKRLILISVGLVCLALGIIGYILPGLPGTIWLIVAASLFVRSSERLYNFVIRNKLFGRQVRGFMETGQMPFRAKVFSLGSMWAFTIISVLFAPYGLFFDLPVILLAISGTFYILTRPTEPPSRTITSTLKEIK
ncbi:MAG: DUF454 domain-containing protein [SAR202 cluster bacterium]|nr:DUF454 domain-containing protein [SAR202 cluster bacterium]|tara:strand:- start:465 stop:875 length:411 start_codon:yes stop_codon:yes gene_type:complete